MLFKIDCKKHLFLIIGILFNTISYAETDTQLMASGQWRDPKTGLIWMRCSIGQKWTGSDCTGEGLTFEWQEAQDYIAKFNGKSSQSNWEQAKNHIKKFDGMDYIRKFNLQMDYIRKFNLQGKGFAGKTNWRMPSVLELNTLIKKSQVPSIDTDIFPNTQEGKYCGLYWSSSVSRIKNQAGGICFHDYEHLGRASHFKDRDGYILLVRSQ